MYAQRMMKGFVTLVFVFVLGFLLGRANTCMAAEVEAMAKLSHGSDLFRDCPFKCSVLAEPQYDALTGGVTITAGKARAWEIDLSHGFKRVNGGDVEAGSEFAVRWYPGRLRK